LPLPALAQTVAELEARIEALEGLVAELASQQSTLTPSICSETVMQTMFANC